MIVESTGMAIEDIFAQHGEDEFRRIERETLASVARSHRQVVSTGGGIIMDERNRAVMDDSGVIVLLEARPETLLARLRQQEADEGDDLVARPMLDADDLVERIYSLKAQRQFNYTRAHWTVHTDFLSPTQAAEEVVRGFNMVKASLNRPDKATPDSVPQSTTPSPSTEETERDRYSTAPSPLMGEGWGEGEKCEYLPM